MFLKSEEKTGVRTWSTALDEDLVLVHLNRTFIIPYPVCPSIHLTTLTQIMIRFNLCFATK